MDAILKKNAINFGVISGLIGVAITTLMYLVDLKLFVNMWIGFGMLAIWIVIGCVLLSKSKKERAGVLTFKEGFTTYFLSAFIGILISTAFNMFLLNFFDTEARDIINQNLIDDVTPVMNHDNTVIRGLERFRIVKRFINIFNMGARNVKEFIYAAA